MTLDYDLTPRAVRDITSARDWYDRQRRDLGNRFVEAVLRAVRSARENPLRFPEIEPGVRGAGCQPFPYRIYYEVMPDRIVVLAVYHAKRDPRKWNDADRE